MNDRSQRLNLPSVTLVVVDTAFHKLTEAAAKRTLKMVDFGDILLFSDTPLDLPALTIKVDLKSNREAQRFMWTGVGPYLRTSHALYIQWDGWVVDTALWQRDFLECDWLGARWGWFPNLRVGNGGFSLRSKRLLDALAASRDVLPFETQEDETICRKYRSYLEKTYGLKWGSEEQAVMFSNECDVALPLGFGFHAVWNLVSALTEDECIEVFRELTPAQFSPVAQTWAWHRACAQNKHKIQQYLQGMIGK